MEDRTLNEKESLELITRMIQNSKKNMELGSGKYLPAVGIPLGSDGGRGAVAGVADGHHEVELAVVCHPFAGVAFAGVSGEEGRASCVDVYGQGDNCRVECVGHGHGCGCCGLLYGC